MNKVLALAVGLEFLANLMICHSFPSALLSFQFRLTPIFWGMKNLLGKTNLIKPEFEKDLVFNFERSLDKKRFLISVQMHIVAEKVIDPAVLLPLAKYSASFFSARCFPFLFYEGMFFKRIASKICGCKVLVRWKSTVKTPKD